MKSGDLVVFRMLIPNGMGTLGWDALKNHVTLILDDDDIDGAGARLVDIMENEWLDTEQCWITSSAMQMLNRYRSLQDKGCDELPLIWEKLSVRHALIESQPQIIVFNRSERCQRLGSQRACRRSRRTSSSKSETQSTI